MKNSRETAIKLAVLDQSRIDALRANANYWKELSEYKNAELKRLANEPKLVLTKAKTEVLVYTANLEL